MISSTAMKQLTLRASAQGCARSQGIAKGTTMAEDVILTAVADRVATLTFNRPDKLNALSHDLIIGSIDCLKRWSLDPEIGAIVVTGVEIGRAQSELQSLRHLVCRLLLEKKKK